jgi:hypothetical protein
MLAVSNAGAAGLFVRDAGNQGGFYLPAGATVILCWPFVPQGAITVTGDGASTVASYREGIA